ncbi:MAG: 3-deoxy-8-phosphooctulonate synthase [bacterium]|nr:3-deoxy-8-phosphooctulonate synthase [bacterium]
MTLPSVQLGPVPIGAGQPLALIAGPCVIESLEHSLELAERIAQIARRQGFPLVFKASFDKANRSSGGSFRGPGLEEGLAVLTEVRRRFDLPVISDIHLPDQATAAGEVLDCLQIPAFLCRQTDLLLAAGRAGRCVNVKKGQFMAPEHMAGAVEKIRAIGNKNVLLTERGTFFGYGRLVNDFTAIPRMRRYAPVVFDATHSCQLPGAAGEITGGQREFVPLLALAGVAAGADALFLEVHDDPDRAKSDPATVYPLDGLESLLERCRRVAEAVGVDRPVAEG